MANDEIRRFLGGRYERHLSAIEAALDGGRPALRRLFEDIDAGVASFGSEVMADACLDPAVRRCVIEAWARETVLRDAIDREHARATRWRRAMLILAMIVAVASIVVGRMLS
jgi:hypothetical protein